MGQKEVSLLLMKNICVSVEYPFVMCYDDHTVGHHITRIDLAGGYRFAVLLLFTSIPVIYWKYILIAAAFQVSRSV